ncbi:MAG: DUF1761 domain-containing protein, partial [Candidatus Uhrbacteria bacterium]|nr:DUF1761 domain-containing protein [Candidatus Uhrbacteria bacterium]
EVSINYWVVLGAAVVSMVLGALWYGPLFGKQWVALMGWTDEQLNVMKKRGGMAKLYGIAFLGSLVMSFVLANTVVFVGVYTHTAGIYAGLMAGFWGWLGFIAPVTLGAVLWEGKSWRLWILNNGYNLLSLLLMGTILAFWI